ncbi:hypothetical protein G7054_g4426 [Neopestalotiopsis clavispora]|nr:hypothetical protein G7054_g4426 [Neopestalotiopsis clavispora]
MTPDDSSFLLEPLRQDVPDSTPSNHVRGVIQGRRVGVQLASQWYLPLAYLVYTVLFTWVIVFWLNGKSFAVDGSPGIHEGVTQSNVTTLVSVALVVARIISSTWQALAAWRCVFILLETSGLSLSEASHLISRRLPTFTLLSPLSSRGANHAWTRTIAILVLILAWPAQFTNPIANGSIYWIHGTITTSISFNTPSSPSNALSWYYRFPDSRDSLVKASAARAGLALVALNNATGSSLVPPAQRIVPNLNSYPAQPVIKNVTVPIFKIEEFEWITNVTELPERILEAVHNSQSGYLNISKYTGPLEQAIAGTSALLKDEAWRAPSDLRLHPAKPLTSEERYAAISISRYWNQGNAAKYDCHSAESVFDPLPEHLGLINNPWSNNYSDCIAVAKIKVSAGVTNCWQENPSPSTKPNCLLTNGIVLANNATVSGDVLLPEVLAAMSEVQGLVAALGLRYTNTMHGALEAYLRNSLTAAYQGAWSALVDVVTDPDHNTQTNIWQPSSLLEARVLTGRMYLWLIINNLLVLSALLLFVTQSHYKVHLVKDLIAAAIMIDSSEVASTENEAEHERSTRKLYLQVDEKDKSHHKLALQPTARL